MSATAAQLIGELYATAPADFVNERNRVVKELKAAGHAELSATVKALRRPKLAEHALNRVARDDSDVIARFVTAADTAREAQAAAIGGDATKLREATNELRTATAAVVESAVAALTAEGGGGESQRDEITALLREAISAGTELLSAGVMGSADVELPTELFAGAPEPPKATVATAAPKASSSKSKSRTETARAGELAQPAGGRSAAKAAAKPKAARTPEVKRSEPEPIRLSAKEAREQKTAQARLERARRDAQRAVSDIDLAIADIEAEINTRARRLANLQDQRGKLVATYDEAQQALDAFEDSLPNR